MSDPRLCVFVKAPVVGRVKSRLAADLGERPACAAYESVAERVLQALSSTPLPKELWVSGGIAHPKINAWAARFGFGVRAQPAGDLGAKMLAAVASCRRAGCAGLVVGADLPELDAAYVEEAAAALRRHEVVLGPTEDGGYGLIGLREPVAELFADMPWGTAAVLAETRARIAELKLRLAELPVLWDLDDLAGWRRFQALAGRLRNAAPEDSPPMSLDMRQRER